MHILVGRRQSQLISKPIQEMSSCFPGGLFVHDFLCLKHLFFCMIGDTGSGGRLPGLWSERNFGVSSRYFLPVYNDLVKYQVGAVAQSCLSFSASGVS